MEMHTLLTCHVNHGNVSASTYQLYGYVGKVSVYHAGEKWPFCRTYW